MPDHAHCCCVVHEEGECEICAVVTCGGAAITAANIRLLVGSTQVAEADNAGSLCATVSSPVGTGTIIVEGPPGYTTANQNVEWECDTWPVEVKIRPTHLNLAISITWADVSGICGTLREHPTTADYDVIVGGVTVAGGTVTEGTPADVSVSWPDVEPPLDVTVVFTQSDPCWELETSVATTIDCAHSSADTEIAGSFDASGECLPLCCWPWDPPTVCHYTDGDIELDLYWDGLGWAGCAPITCEAGVVSVLYGVGPGPQLCKESGAFADGEICVRVSCQCVEPTGTVEFSVYKDMEAYQPYIDCNTYEPIDSEDWLCYPLAIAAPVGDVVDAPAQACPPTAVGSVTTDCTEPPVDLSLSGSLEWLIEQPTVQCFTLGGFTLDFHWGGEEGPSLASPRAPRTVDGSDASEPPLPGKLAMLASYARSTVRHVRAGRPQAPPELLAARLAACNACDHLRPSDRRCGLVHGCGCGCLVESKARRLHETCPIDAWPKPKSEAEPLTRP
jgi:hypothetical protein